MSRHSRTARASSKAAVFLLVVCITGVSVVAAAAADDDRAPAAAGERQRRLERHQHVSDCSTVHQYARRSMQYTNVLPATKSHAHPALEVCVPSGDSRTAAHHRTCCTRTLERHMHQSAMDAARQAITSSPIFRRLQTNVAKAAQLQELIRDILMVAANATQAALRSNSNVDDRGAVSALATSLYDYVTGADVNVLDGVMRFFDHLFAAVYLNGTSHGVQPATVDCVAAVRRHREGAWVPFGAVDSSVGNDLTRSARVARVLVESLRVAGVVTQSLESVEFSHQCSRALTRLRYCAACDGVVEPALPRPCRQFCANVARGCLVHLVAGQIGRRWEHFIDATNQLAVFGVKGRTDLEGVMDGLPALLSDEVSRLQSDIQKYHSEVRSKCGHVPHGHHQRRHATTTVVPSGESFTHRRRHEHDVGNHRRQRRASSLQRAFADVAHGLLSTRELFARLPEQLCRDEQLKVGRDDPCWNGTDVAPYERAVIRLSIDAQSTHNPEMRVTVETNPNVVSVADQLQHVTQSLRDHSPPQHNYHDNGSGNYYYYYYYDRDDEDGYYASGSGSGDSEEQQINDESTTSDSTELTFRTLRTKSTTSPVYVTPTTTRTASAASSSHQQSHLFVAVTSLVVTALCPVIRRSLTSC